MSKREGSGVVDILVYGVKIIQKDKGEGGGEIKLLLKTRHIGR